MFLLCSAYTLVAAFLIWILVVAALSDKAISAIGGELNFARFPLTYIKLHTFGYIASEIFKRQYGTAWQAAYDSFFEMITEPRYEDVYQVREDVCMAYFDHKLPDQLSTITKIIAFDDSTNDKTISRRSLIEGCDDSNYTFDGQEVDIDEVVGEFDQDTVCPESFYKSINFEYDGDEIDSGQSFSEFVAEVVA